ncbi:MAG: amidohydrolase [Clostridia bacterium]|nr:amidohydrolase [Clostridia bacterium]
MFTPAQLIAAVDRHSALIHETEAWLWKHPETGFREWKSHEYLKNEFQKLGYTLREAGNIPGFTADIDTGRPGPRILILGELDSLICIDHPDADPETHAVHSCGHHAQCAALLGIAAALKEPGILNGLSGSVRLCAVPAEELIETGYRETLRAQGIIRYMGGKVEFMHRGFFDDVDMAILLHTSGGDHDFVIGVGGNGCIVKNIYYQGRAVHASGAYEGVNALYAANLGMQAINALRETFRDEDHIRVHPIITKGGTAVNAIPSDVRMESYVRGASMEAILKANKRVNRALAASAAAMGAQVRLEDRPGYAPLNNDKNLSRIALEAMKAISPEEKILVHQKWDNGCTDMGDLSAVMPAIQPCACGAVGTGHGNDYRIADVNRACVNSAKAQVMMLSLLMKDDAEEAKRVVAEKQTVYPSIREYFETVDKITLDQDAVKTNEDGTLTLTFVNPE